MSKQSMREEAERLIRESMARKTIVVKQGNTRIEAICGNKTCKEYQDLKGGIEGTVTY